MNKVELVIEATKEYALELVNEAIQNAKHTDERVELLVLKNDILESCVTEKKLTI